ncbi:MAG: IS200/IS605 family transposase [Lachnospiraceae bacterium]|nr:IS200/IS605 family transposase [Lachnospiraceae bacterium]
MSKQTYTYARTCVYNINYHIIWCTKYRRKVLSSKIESRLNEILTAIGVEKGFSVVKSNVGESDHIHVFVSAPPKLSPTDIVRYLKGISGRLLLMEFPEIKSCLWNGHLWNDSYFLETIGSTSEENILHYIERQKDHQA